ncbi:MAG TPA: hypothetical protein EYG85_06380 [Crocinitomix sp.]|nr:hypothetical protein [Crocinitomix sp.]
MIKLYLVGVILIGSVLNSTAQTPEKNKEYCKTIIDRKQVDRVKSVYQIPVLSATEKEELKTFLYQTKSIYDIEFVSSAVETIVIYHISDITIVDLKHLLVQKNYYIRLITNQILNKIEKQ